MKAFQLALFAFIITGHALGGELVHIGQKYKDRQGHVFFPLTFAVPTNFSVNCAENNGRGRFDALPVGDDLNKRLSCSVLLAPLEQLRSFAPARLVDTMHQFVLPKGDLRKVHHQSNALVIVLPNGTTLRAHSNGVGFIFKKAGFSPIYLNGVRHNFEGFERPVDGHYMEFQVSCQARAKNIDERCNDVDMRAALEEIAPAGAPGFTTNAKVPRGHPEYEESPYGI
jgi:hypothetical protein